MKNCPLSKNGCVHFDDDKLHANNSKEILGFCEANNDYQRSILVTDTQCPCPDLMQEPEKSLAERIVERVSALYVLEYNKQIKDSVVVNLRMVINKELEKEKSNGKDQS